MLKDASRTRRILKLGITVILSTKLISSWATLTNLYPFFLIKSNLMLIRTTYAWVKPTYVSLIVLIFWIMLITSLTRWTCTLTNPLVDDTGSIDFHTHGNGLSWIGRQASRPHTFTATWQMKTTRKASAYESTAAFRVSGSRLGMISVVCLVEATKSAFHHISNRNFSHRIA